MHQVDNQTHSTTRNIAVFTTLFTGATGLIYEVTWQKYLANFLGSEAKATAIILAVFLGGLCLGYSLFGNISRKKPPQTLVKLCGWIEIGIGAWALIFPMLYTWTWNTIGLRDPGSSFSLIIDISISIFLIGLPTTLMGCTLPLLTQGLSKNLRDSSSFHALVYATNTGGAFFGCLLAGFFLLPTYGLALTILGTAFVNILAGFILLGCGSMVSETKEECENESTITGQMPYRKALIVAFLAGFYSLALQTVFIRLIALSMGSSEYAFSMIVAVFVLMLAIGAWSVSKSERGGFQKAIWQNQLYVLIGLLVLFFLIPAWPYATHIIRVHFTSIASAFYAYHACMFLVAALLMAIPIGAMGSTLPLLFRDIRAETDKLGSYVGHLYSVNTVGCALGAVIGGYAALYIINLPTLYTICLILVSISIALTFPWKTHLAFHSTKIGIGVILLLITYSAVSPWNKERFAIGTFRATEASDVSFSGINNFYKMLYNGKSVLAYKDDPNTSVAVIEETLKQGDTDSTCRSIYVNGKSDGTTIGADLRTTRMLAHLPALLQNAKEKTAAVIGFGTGITVGSLGLYSEIENIDCIEISPFIKEFAPLFDSFNHEASKSKKLRWTIHDAYRALATKENSYAIIVSEPSNPWVTGVERLFATEFYELVKSKLDDKGVYAQWFHAYSISEPTLGLVLNTFGSAFPEVRVFAVDSDLILLGSKTPFTEENILKLSERMRRADIRKDLNEVSMGTPISALALEQWVDTDAFSKSGIQTLDFPQLAYAAGKDFFSGAVVDINLIMLSKNQAWTSTAGRKSLLSKFIGDQSPTLDELREAYRVYCSEGFKVSNNYEDNSSRACATTAAALSIALNQPLPLPLTVEDLSTLKALVTQTVTPEDIQSISQAKNLAFLFKDLRSPFLQLKPAGLETARSICEKENSDAARECLLEISLAFAYHGFFEQASKTIASLESQGDPEITTRAKKQLEFAAKVSR